MPHALLGCALFAAGCSNPACDLEVTERLLDDCQIGIGHFGSRWCFDRPDAPTGDEGFDVRIEHVSRTCEIASPTLDATCLKTESCEAILGGACDASESLTFDPACLRRCQREADACSSSCADGQGATFESCLECDLECAEDAEVCEEACVR
jgi:hypothetical protein